MSELPLQSNVWRITAQSGIPGQAEIDAYKRAANLALSGGYSHFIVRDAQSGSQRRVAGYTPAFATTTYAGTGYYRTATTTVTGGNPIVARSDHVTITAVFLNPGDPGFSQAFDARQFLTNIEASGY